MHLDGVDQIDLSIVICMHTQAQTHTATSLEYQNVVRQEEEAKQGAAGTGEDLCHPSGYNRRLRATQSPNNVN